MCFLLPPFTVRHYLYIGHNRCSCLWSKVMSAVPCAFFQNKIKIFSYPNARVVFENENVQNFENKYYPFNLHFLTLNSGRTLFHKILKKGEVGNAPPLNMPRPMANSLICDFRVLSAFNLFSVHEYLARIR